MFGKRKAKPRQEAAVALSIKRNPEFSDFVDIIQVASADDLSLPSVDGGGKHGRGGGVRYRVPAGGGGLTEGVAPRRSIVRAVDPRSHTEATDVPG